jgi:hypothetical protein
MSFAAGGSTWATRLFDIHALGSDGADYRRRHEVLERQNGQLGIMLRRAASRRPHSPKSQFGVATSQFSSKQLIARRLSIQRHDGADMV